MEGVLFLLFLLSFSELQSSLDQKLLFNCLFGLSFLDICIRSLLDQILLELLLQILNKNGLKLSKVEMIRIGNDSEENSVIQEDD